MDVATKYRDMDKGGRDSRWDIDISPWFSTMLVATNKHLRRLGRCQLALGFMMRDIGKGSWFMISFWCGG
jgi:hypothetical protein